MEPLDFEAVARTLRIDPTLNRPVPAVCGYCAGAGWVVRRDEQLAYNEVGQLVSCPACKGGTHATIARCWAVGDLREHDGRAPDLASLTPLATADATEEMIRAARTFALRPRGWLTFHGNAGKQGAKQKDLRTGAGKTILAEAIARYLLANDIPTLFIRATELTVYLGATLHLVDDPIDYEARLRWVRDVPVLVIDDLGTESASPFVERTLYRLLDTRATAAERDQGGATVLTSNLHPDAWPARLGSRAMNARFIQVLAGAVDVRRLVPPPAGGAA